MPIDDPSPELQEAIRLNGRCDKTGVRAQWGYHATEQARVFLLADGEGLPTGWFDCRAAAKAGRRSERLTLRKA